MAVRKRSNQILFATSAFLLILNVYFYNGKQRFVHKKTSDILNKFAKFSFDYISPPPCAEPNEEAIRLNELIANPWYKCRRTKRLPDESFGYQICLDDNVGVNLLTNGRFTFVAVTSESDDFQLERILLRLGNPNANISALIISKRTRLPPSLLEHENKIILRSLDEEQSENVSATYLFNELKTFAFKPDGGHIDILRLDYASYGRPLKFPRLLAALTALNGLDNVRQLHLTIRIDEEDHELLYLWYRTIYNLFHSATYGGSGFFALYSAQQMGECGRRILQCQYQLAFAKIPNVFVDLGRVSILAPVAGMGSPDEEYNRLLWYLTQKINETCAEKRRTIILGEPNNEWVICDDLAPVENCAVYHFSIGDSQAFLDSPWSSYFPTACKAFLFDPLLPYDQRYGAENVEAYSVTLADKSSEQIQPGLSDSKNWKLATLDDLLEKTNTEKYIISLMLVDLHGGEWDVFEQILSAASVPVLSQLVLRVHVWNGEENENYRRFYSWFHLLERTGFAPFSFRRIFNDTGSQRHECRTHGCYELGWSRLH